MPRRRRDRDDDYEDDRDYDDDDRRRRRRPQDNSGRTLLIIFGILGGLFLLCVAVCAGFIFYGVSSVKTLTQDILQTQSVSEQFVEDCKNNRFKDAYENTSNEYQAANTKEQFESAMKKYPLITKHLYKTQNNVNMPGMNNQKVNTAKMSYTLYERPIAMTDEEELAEIDPGEIGPNDIAKKKDVPPVFQNPLDELKKPNRSIKITLNLIKEKEKWVVNSFDISE